MITPRESLAIATGPVDRHKLVPRLRRHRTTATAPGTRTEGQGVRATARPEPGFWKTLGPIVLDAPSELAPRLEASNQGNPLAVALAIAVVVAALAVIAITVFLATREASRPDSPPHTSTGLHPDSTPPGAAVRVHRAGNALTAGVHV